MYIKKEALIELYQDFMNKMSKDMEIADDFKGPLTDDYLEGIHAGLSAAQHVFKTCYREACRK